MCLCQRPLRGRMYLPLGLARVPADEEDYRGMTEYTAAEIQDLHGARVLLLRNPALTYK